MSELKIVRCFSELHKSNILHIRNSLYNTSCSISCSYVPISKFVNSLNKMFWTLRTFKFEASRNFQAQWWIQAVDEACALWPTSKGISEISMHHTEGISGATWWGWAMSRRSEDSSPLRESQLPCRSVFLHQGLGVMHKEFPSFPFWMPTDDSI